MPRKSLVFWRKLNRGKRRDDALCTTSVTTQVWRKLIFGGNKPTEQGALQSVTSKRFFFVSPCSYPNCFIHVFVQILAENAGSQGNLEVQSIGVGRVFAKEGLQWGRRVRLEIRRGQRHSETWSQTRGHRLEDSSTAGHLWQSRPSVWTCSQAFHRRWRFVQILIYTLFNGINSVMLL